MLNEERGGLKCSPPVRWLSSFMIGSCALLRCNASGRSFTTIGPALVPLYQFHKHRGAVTTGSGLAGVCPGQRG